MWLCASIKLVVVSDCICTNAPFLYLYVVQFVLYDNEKVLLFLFLVFPIRI